MFYYDLVMGHRWLVGGDALLTGCEQHREAGRIPLHEAARLLIRRVLEQLSPAARLVITLQEIEERPVKEISQLTGWSVPLVKVRAFRARAEMRKILANMAMDKYL